MTRRSAIQADVPFSEPGVEAAFAAFPFDQRNRLLELRALIFEAAAEVDGVGDIVETLKWGQPSYLPARPRVGSTVRLGGTQRSDRVAMFFHCQSRLVETFREIYPDQLEFEGNRAICLPIDESFPVESVKHCVSLCLTYHLRRKSGS